MSNLQKRVQKEAYQLVFGQIFCILILTLLGLIISDRHHALDILLGGLAYALPNLIFVWRVFRFAGAHQMAAFMVAFFLGETIKLFFSAFLVLLIVKTFSHSLLSVLVGYIGAIVSFWIACVWHMLKEAKAKQQALW